MSTLTTGAHAQEPREGNETLVSGSRFGDGIASTVAHHFTKVVLQQPDSEKAVRPPVSRQPVLSLLTFQALRLHFHRYIFSCSSQMSLDLYLSLFSLGLGLGLGLGGF